MLRFDCEQGSGEWTSLRLGIPTASRFDEIITPKTMKPSSSGEKYAWELLAEQILGYPVEEAPKSGFMVRGTVLEQKAVDFYELERDVDTEKVGFVMRDDRRVGCSPDRLVGIDGLLEIKCPSAKVHVGYMLDDEGSLYHVQTQGQLWLTEREWCDIESHNPELGSIIFRVGRDEKFIKALSSCVDAFLETMDEMKAKLTRRGYFPELAEQLAKQSAKVA
jgi:hypothetical protein